MVRDVTVGPEAGPLLTHCLIYMINYLFRNWQQTNETTNLCSKDCFSRTVIGLIFFILSLVLHKFETVCNKVAKSVDHGHVILSLTSGKLCRP